VQPGTGKQKEERKKLARNQKGKDCLKKKEIGEFSPSDPYKMEITLAKEVAENTRTEHSSISRMITWIKTC
jgi:hypothetical protein